MVGGRQGRNSGQGRSGMRFAIVAAVGCLAAALAAGAQAQAQASGPSGGSKACLLGTGMGINAAPYRATWQSVTPVPDSWTWQDCQNMAHKADFDVVGLACIYPAADRQGPQGGPDFSVGAFWATANN